VRRHALGGNVFGGMVLFPIALLWVAGVIIWVIRKGGFDPERPDDARQRWPRRPRGTPRPESPSVSTKRGLRRSRRHPELSASPGRRPPRTTR